MTTWNRGQIKTKVKNDLDLTDEIMITDEEMNGYVQEAVDEAEQHIMTADEDYGLQKVTLSLVAGTQEYSLPSNIYAHKIRRIVYDNGSEHYEVKKLRNLGLIPEVEESDDYRYLIIKDPTNVSKLLLYPTSRETSSNVTIWFVGNANEMTSDSTVLSLPEAAQFIIAHVKRSCLRKEGHPGQVAQDQEVERQRLLFIETLQVMTPDEDNKITLDTSYYDDQGCW